MITPWEIYWVLQLDSFGAALSFVVSASILVSAALIAVSLFFAADTPSAWCAEENKAAAIRHNQVAPILRKAGIRILVFIVAPLFTLAVLLPSTKTAAAMIVVPQIVNSPTIQHEAGDLYNLAKEALRDAIAPKPERKQ